MINLDSRHDIFLVRPDDPGTDRGSLCFRACSSVLLVHTMGGRLLTLLSAPICIPQAHGSCSFSLRVFPQGLSIHGTKDTRKNLLA